MDKQQSTAVPVRNTSARPMSRPAMPHAQQPQPAAKRKSTKKWKIVLGVLAALVLVGAITYMVLGIGSGVDRSKYQAVFLTNGQVYFGKLSGWGSANPTLTDVYYFQAADERTTQREAGQEANNNNTQTLIKLGEEIHKPSDRLILNRDSILFVENIEDDGQVVQAIKRNQENK